MRSLAGHRDHRPSIQLHGSPWVRLVPESPGIIRAWGNRARIAKTGESVQAANLDAPRESEISGQEKPIERAPSWGLGARPGPIGCRGRNPIKADKAGWPYPTTDEFKSAPGRQLSA